MKSRMLSKSYDGRNRYPAGREFANQVNGSIVAAVIFASKNEPFPGGSDDKNVVGNAGPAAFNEVCTPVHDIFK